MPEPTDPTVVPLRRWWAVSVVALVVATWPLWTPQRDFPQVPFVRAAGALPTWVDWLALAGMLGAAGVTVLRRSPVALGVFVAAATVSVLVDQHRFQPWVWQCMLLAVVLAGSTSRQAVFWTAVLTAGIYLHSGLSKLDASFVQSHGQTFVTVAAETVGLDATTWPSSVRTVAALVFPVGELLVVAALLVFPRRRWWLLLSFVLHGGLLVLLGPWGLDQQPGVLLWNVYFLGQNAILYRGGPSLHEAERLHPLGLLLGAALLLPFLEPWGYFDSWPSWAVYATRAEQVEVEIRGDAVDRLPPELQRFVAAGDEFGWRPLAVDRWSLAALGAPSYPQSRFTLGVALAVSERYGLDDAIRVVVRGPADRFTGRRWTTVATGRAELERLAERHWVNWKSVRA